MLDEFRTMAVITSGTCGPAMSALSLQFEASKVSSKVFASDGAVFQVTPTRPAGACLR